MPLRSSNIFRGQRFDLTPDLKLATSITLVCTNMHPASKAMPASGVTYGLEIEFSDLNYVPKMSCMDASLASKYLH